MFEEEFLDVMTSENLHVFEEEFLDVEEEILDVMTTENLHVFEEEFLDVEEEILDVMEAENLHVIEEERSVTVSAPRKPKRVKLMAPLKLIRSGKIPDRSGHHKVTKNMARKHVQSDGMELNFDEIVPEEGVWSRVMSRERHNTMRSGAQGVTQGVGQTSAKATKYGRRGHGVHTRFGFFRAAS